MRAEQWAEMKRREQAREPPDLQGLVVEYGTWDLIPAAAWADYDRRLRQWQLWLAGGNLPR